MVQKRRIEKKRFLRAPLLTSAKPCSEHEHDKSRPRAWLHICLVSERESGNSKTERPHQLLWDSTPPDSGQLGASSPHVYLSAVSLTSMSGHIP